MNWHVACITTRRETPTLERTLDSLAAAGWPHVITLSDRQGVGCWQAWLWAAKVVMSCIRKINDDRILIVEDDALHAASLRDYLEANPEGIFDRNDVVSLYTSSFNHSARIGWSEVQTIGGPIRTYGALSLAIPVRLMPALLNDTPNPGKRNETDHNIGLFCRREGVRYLCHSPSFVKHIGCTSTLPDAGVDEFRREAAWCSHALTPAAISPARE
jgi:hypothetical protein